jgi:hypothetical protein
LINFPKQNHKTYVSSKAQLGHSKQNIDPFGLACFWVYAKQLMQINKLLCMIHKLVKVVYEKNSYEDTIFVSENLWNNIKAYLFV